MNTTLSCVGEQPVDENKSLEYINIVLYITFKVWSITYGKNLSVHDMKVSSAVSCDEEYDSVMCGKITYQLKWSQ